VSVHELGLCAAIVEAVERRAGDRPVARVTVRVGRLHHVHLDAFQQSFEVAAMGSVAESAAAEVVLLPVRNRCAGCGEEFESEEPALACPGCDAVEVEPVGGDELVLQSIEYRA
jgi:hydrogenase nickel incorporation protein HypA/HybF